MNIADRENQTSREYGAEGQNRSCTNKWAAKQEKLQPFGVVFFLDFYLYRTNRELTAPLNILWLINFHDRLPEHIAPAPVPGSCQDRPQTQQMAQRCGGNGRMRD